MIAGAEMYLKPRQVFEKFIVEEKISRVNDIGRQVVEFRASGAEIFGVVSSAESYEREKFKGLKHEISHVIIQKLGAQKAKVGDRLIKGEKIFYIEAVDNPAGLGQWFLYYCSERNNL